MYALLIIALILFLLGFFTIAKWLLIVAVVLLILALVGGFGPAGWGWGYRRRGPY